MQGQASAADGAKTAAAWRGSAAKTAAAGGAAEGAQVSAAGAVRHAAASGALTGGEVSVNSDSSGVGGTGQQALAAAVAPALPSLVAGSVRQELAWQQKQEGGVVT